MKKLIKVFTKTIALIVLPIGMFYFYIGLLPADRFTFRLWEAFRYKKQVSALVGPFYESQKGARNEVGDLFPYTHHAVLKSVNWETDSYGFRNHSLQGLAKVEIVVGGDSSAVGTAMTQENTLSEMLSRKTGALTYNLGGIDFVRIPNYLLALNLKPRVFVLVLIERFLTELPDNFEASKPSLVPAGKLNQHYQKWHDHLFYNPFQSYKSKHGIMDSLKHIFVPITDPDMAPKPYEFKMGFVEGKDVAKLDESRIVSTAARRIAYIRNFFSAHGIQFLLVCVPNKETTYYDQVPLAHQPSILPLLHAELRNQRVDFIDLFENFNLRYRQGHSFSHHLDDSHWNEVAVSATADLIYEYIYKQK